MTAAPWRLVCVDCAAEYPGLEPRYRCDCDGTLDVIHDLEHLRGVLDVGLFERRLGSRDALDRSGVWRYRELIFPLDDSVVCRGEGNTGLYRSERLSEFTGVDRLSLKHEGENPTGSFKDRGMTVGVTAARRLGMSRVACASTGNTAASLAAYAAIAGIEALVFVPEGKVTGAKLSQALAYGARVLQIAGEFDDAMQLVERTCEREDTYLLNSVNPFRVEGQKAIAFEILQNLEWETPDWIAVPGGNLGNSSAIYKGLNELHELGLIPRVPRIAVIQAEGASPLYTAFVSGEPLRPVATPRTVASAIRIGNPLSWRKSLRGVHATGGVVEKVSDQEIVDAKAWVDAAGIGAEPASCAAIAGVRKLAAAGVIGRDARVCAVLTGHVLKDPDTVVGYHTGALEGVQSTYANTPVSVAADLDAILETIRKWR